MDEAQEAYVPVVPPNGRQELLIPDDLDPDEAFTLVFKNELVTGCFIVRKLGLTNDEASVLGASFNVAGWGFKLLRKDGSVARQGVTDGRGEIRFDNLPLGPYIIVEEDRPGWNEVSADELESSFQAISVMTPMRTPGCRVPERTRRQWILYRRSQDRCQRWLRYLRLGNHDRGTG